MLQQQAFVAMQRAADRLMRDMAVLLKPRGISPTQYNVLRILRGSRPKPLSCSEVAERMITHAPDMTRLLDRLAGTGLISRARESEDRRVVRTAITEKGLELLASLDAPVRRVHQKQFASFSEDKLTLLVDLLSGLAE